MEQPTAVIEITNSVIRIVIGYVVDGKPAIIYTREVPTQGTVERGEIKDHNGLVQILSEFKTISDPQAKLRINVKEAAVILPPIGFEVFQTTKTTNVVSSTSTIEPIDIQNAISLVSKETIPNGSDVIDIIPESFLLEGNRMFGEPPLGQKSSSVTLKAFVHTLPVHIVDSYRRAFEGAGIIAKRTFVSSYALTHFTSHVQGMYADAIVMDMGEGVTSFTLMGKHYPYASQSILMGAKDLRERVAQTFGISEEEAKRIIELYGVDDSISEFSPAITRSVNESGVKAVYKTSDLNNVISSFMSDYFKQIDVALANLTKGFPEEVNRFPIIVSGDFSRLHGLNIYLENKFTNSKEIKFICPKSLGVRYPRFVNAIGALYLSNKYRGSLTDQRAKVAQVSRESSEDK